MRHEFHPDAYAEYEEAARYYAERDPDPPLDPTGLNVPARRERLRACG
jgi:hypothetical protein